MKNPKTRFILFLVLLIVEVGLLINSLNKDIDFSSFEDWLDSQLFLNSILTFSFSIQTWLAYEQMKKTKKQEVM